MQPGMAGFLPQNLQAFTPESIDLAHLRQRQALADALLQSSATPISTQRQSGRFVSAISPLEGLTKLAEAYIGSRQHKAIEQDSRDMAGNRAKRFVEALRGKSSIAPEERPSESLGAPYNADAYDTKTPNPYNVPGATAPQWMDPTRPSSGLQANSVEVRGKVPQEQPQAPDPIAQMRAQVADYVEQGVMSPDQGMQLLSGLQQKMLEQQMQRPTYTYQTTGDGQIVGLPNTGGAAIQTGVRGEQKAPTFVDSGAGVDSSGRPLVVPKRWDAAQGKAVDVEGVQPVTKGPLATASASVSTKDAFKNERDLRNDLKSEPIYKAHQEVKAAFAQIKGSAGQNTPISDVALATKIMKLLDPGSVVRESELGIAMAASGLLDRVTNYANMVKTGQKLTPQQRTDFLKLADEFYSASEQQFNAKAAEYAGIAKDYNLNAGRVSGQAPSGKPGAKKGRHWVVGPDGSVTEQK
jgi:hypothetical protein